jgi:hypothetical protein
MFAKRSSIKSKFGIYTIDKDKTDIKFDYEAITKNQINDFVLRETGIGRKIKKNDNIYTALKDPSEYINERNKALGAKAKELADIYINMYKKFLNRGFTQKRAEELAKEEVIHIRNKFYNEINEEYPVTIEDKFIASKLTDKK